MQDLELTTKRVTNLQLKNRQYVIGKPKLDEASDRVTPSGPLTNSKDQPDAARIHKLPTER